jgi:hypothetical protein
MKIFLMVYLWLLVGDLLLAVRKWEYDTSGGEMFHRAKAIILWPTSAWWVIRDTVREWRDDLYYRNKHR